MSEEAKETAAAAAPANDGSQQEQTSIHELKKVMHNTTVESNGEHKSLWIMTKETMGMADGGKSKATDTLVDTEPEALVAIKKMIAEAKQKDASSKKPHPGMSCLRNLLRYSLPDYSILSILICFRNVGLSVDSCQGTQCDTG